MNGPPTPPAVSPVEKRDQERDLQNTADPAPVEAAAAQNTPTPTLNTTVTQVPSQPPPNAFRPDLQSIIGLFEQSDVSGAIQRLVYLDKTMSPSTSGYLSVAFMLVLAYMIDDTLPPAYEVLLRLPPIHLSRPAGNGLSSLFASVWENKYDRVYTRAQELHGRVAASLSDFEAEVVPVIQNLLVTFVQKYRVKSLRLLAVAYEAIPASLMEWYLGLSANELLPELEKEGWKYDSSTGILKAPSSSSTSDSGTPASSTLNSFRAIANNVTRLEL
jgi:COP9 signalosome complex subunit 8